jgi:hypothetical protein
MNGINDINDINGDKELVLWLRFLACLSFFDRRSFLDDWGLYILDNISFSWRIPWLCCNLYSSAWYRIEPRRHHQSSTNAWYKSSFPTCLPSESSIWGGPYDTNLVFPGGTMSFASFGVLWCTATVRWPGSLLGERVGQRLSPSLRKNNWLAFWPAVEPDW